MLDIGPRSLALDDGIGADHGAGHGRVLTRPGSGADADEVLTPIDLYLRQQQTMTAVDRFSQHHDADVLPAQARYYRDLIPLERPGPGQQYAFEVDLDSCSGCKACVTACHSLNGLDDDESFRTVGLLVGREATTLEPWQQTVTTACHHCVDPACLNGCPVDAYEKDPVTGIVKHLDDQCIGCSYCTLTCPYEVPRYNASRGIVRKCDLCSDRLAVGEAPACVQACPTSAISVTIAEVADLVAAATAVEVDREVEGGVSGGVDAAPALVPSAPASSLTTPSTRYRSTHALPADAVPADLYSVEPAHSHPPLAVMLVLTQVAVGAFVADLVLRSGAAGAAGSFASEIRPWTAGAALTVGLLALGASILHLGRPRYAWRAVIGLRHSWLSREIVAFSVFAAAAAAYAGALWLDLPTAVVGALGGVVVLSGAAGVLCSIMIYVVTGRRWWRFSTTAPKFALTAVIGGASFTAAVTAVAAAATGAGAGALANGRPLLWAVLAASVAKLALEASILRHRHDPPLSELRRTATLLRGDLGVATSRRVTSGIVGGLVLPVVLLSVWSATGPAVLGWSIALSLAMLALTVLGELLERLTFFTASSSPRMPGGLR